jgi:hypothetical protein
MIYTRTLLRYFERTNPKKTDFTKKQAFQRLLYLQLIIRFFSNTLALSDDEIKLFLVFLENDPKSRMVMNPNDQFKLMDF